MKKTNKRLLTFFSFLLSVLIFASFGLPISADIMPDGNMWEGGFCYSITDGDDGNEYAFIIGYEGDYEDIVIPETLGGYPVVSIETVEENGNIGSGGAFTDNEEIKSLTITHSVKISHEEFSGCSNLTVINLPDEYMYIGHYAFADTGYYNDEDNWDNGVLYIGKHLIKVAKDFSGDLVIKEGTLDIAGGAFEGCDLITGVTVPGTVKEVDMNEFVDDKFDEQSNTFKRIMKLNKLVFNDGVEKLYGFGFSVGSLEIVVPATVKEINDGLISEVEYPDQLTVACYRNSTSDEFAKEHGINIRYLDSEDNKGGGEDNEIEENNNNNSAAVAPKITSGQNGVYVSGTKTGLTFRSTAPLSEFIRIDIDGKELDKKNYTLTEGSTIAELHSDYLSTLASGKHKISIVSASGTAEAEFSVSNNTAKSPKTGDSLTSVWAFGIMLLSGGAFILSACLKKRA